MENDRRRKHKHGMGHVSGEMGRGKCVAWKLLVDPVLEKGTFRVFRKDGVGAPTALPIIPRDPRKQKISTPSPKKEPMMILPVPVFKIDKNFLGEIPPTEVTFTNLNDNMGEMILHKLAMEHGVIEKVEIYHHPVSHRRLGIGRVVFKSSREASSCVKNLNKTLLMGKTVYAFLDPRGKRCKELFSQVTSNYGYPIKQQSLSLSRDMDTTTNTPSSSSVISNPKSAYYNQSPLPPAPCNYMLTSAPDSSTSSRPGLGQRYYLTGADDDDDDYILPRIDLDYRIKMMMEKRDSTYFGHLFTDGNTPSLSDSESGKSDAEMNRSPLKRARLCLRESAIQSIWDSDSDLDNQEQHKENPVPNSTQVRVHSSCSPPPSPFLNCAEESSEDEDMSVSSASPEAPAYSPILPVSESRFNPPTPMKSTSFGWSNCQNQNQGEYYNSTNLPYPQPMSHWEFNRQSQPNRFSGTSEDQNENFANIPPGYSGALNAIDSDSQRNQDIQIPPGKIVPEEALPDHKNPELLVQAVIDRMVPELMDVLGRDLKRKLVDVEAFKIFEDWWTTQDGEYNRKEEEEQAKKQSEPANQEALGTVLDSGVSRLLQGLEITSTKSKPKLDISSSDEGEESDECSLISSKSSLPSDTEAREVTDAEPISSTEDENEFTDEKTTIATISPVLDGDKLLPQNEETETMDIASNPEDEMEDGEVLSTPPKSPLQSDVLNSSMYINTNDNVGFDFANNVNVSSSFYKDEEEVDMPILIPEDVLLPRGSRRGSKKSSKSNSKVSSKPAFRPRNEDEISQICLDFLREGVDEEDMRYFKEAYQNLLCEEEASYWASMTHWVDHCVTKSPRPTCKNEPKPEKGSLRTRGFTRMTKAEKIRALKMNGNQSRMNSVVSVVPANITTDAGVIKARESQNRETRHFQRRLATCLGTESDLLKLNQLQFRKKALKFARSGIHEWGLFAAEPIAQDDMIIEYVGQVIRPVVADLREKKYEEQGIGSSYLFRTDVDTIIDATRCGNLARFLNHSCNANCYTKVITIEGKKKIVIYSKQPIAVSEEITYDYKFPYEDKKIPCLCGTPQCRGSLN